MQALRQRRIHTGEVTLHCADAGEGDLVVLLHGFPDCWLTWKRQIPALAGAGLKVAAPDMRGYNLSDKPQRVADYAIEKLVADVSGLIKELGHERAHVVGHDWGGIVAWHLAMARPEMIDRLVILNVPHPALIPRGFLNPKQLRRSWYVALFQLPELPEWLLGRNDLAYLTRLYSRLLGPRGMGDEVGEFVAAAERSNNLRFPINYYRALLRRRSLPLQTVVAPTLVLWGERDKALRPQLADPPPRWVPDAEVVRFPEATHWVHLDAPDEINKQIIGFLKGESHAA